MITQKPSQPHTVMPTMQYSACDGSWKKLCAGMPNLASAALTMP